MGIEETINKRFDEMGKETSQRFEDLLEAVNTGFQTMEERFQGLGGRFDGLEGRFGNLEKSLTERMERVEDSQRRVWLAIEKWPAPSTVNDLVVRVKYIEGKAGIQPGEAFGQ